MNETTPRPEPRTLPWDRRRGLAAAMRPAGSDRRPGADPRSDPAAALPPVPSVTLRPDPPVALRPDASAALRPEASRLRMAAPTSRRDRPPVTSGPAPGPARAGPSGGEPAPARRSAS